MSDYDYLNARVRGMSTSLLPREFYEQVLSAGSLGIFLSALLGSAYGSDLQQELSVHGQGSTAPAIDAALRRNARSVFARLLSAAPPEPRRLIALQLNRWDVANVLTLLRGKLAGAEPHEALAGVIPIGELEESNLHELAAEKDVFGLADALTTGKKPIGFELRRAVRECEDPLNPRALETALYRAYFTWALAQLRADDPHQGLVRTCICRHIDMMNLLTILTMIGKRTEEMPGEAALYERGTLEEKSLRELRACDALEDAFEWLVGTYLASGVEKGILSYGQSQSLGVMERFLEAVAVEDACRLFRKDMLGVAVPLGFVWRRYSEYINLRLLVRAALFRMPAHAVRLEMVVV
jgi:V/A-type H+-transporting ATPase subunit C